MDSNEALILKVDPLEVVSCVYSDEESEVDRDVELETLEKMKKQSKITSFFRRASIGVARTGLSAVSAQMSAVSEQNVSTNGSPESPNLEV